MAQQRLRDYQSALAAFDHNIFNLGLHNPGRYCGFDTVVRVSALTFNISHDGSGIRYKNPNNAASGPFGILLTPQGDLIKEDAPIGVLAVDTNAGNNSFRYDLLVCSHSHINNAGGQAATYSIIKGAIGSGIKPLLADALKQVAVGVIELPPNASDIANCTFTKSKCPDSGDGEDARLSDPNVFKAIQLFNMSAVTHTAPDITATFGANTAALWKLGSDGNCFKILPASAMTLDGIKISDVPLQEGTQISIFINENVTLRGYTDWLATYQANGYRNFKVAQGIANVVAIAPSLGVKPNAGEIWELEFKFYGTEWVLMKIGGANARSNAFSRGMIVDWHGDVASNFDDTGLGYNLMSGWQICNGLNGTPDGRGKHWVMATVVPSVGAAVIVGNEDTLIHNNPDVIGGNRKITIAQTNLPNYTKPFYRDRKGGDSGNDVLSSANSSHGTVDISVGGDGTPLDVSNMPFYATIKIMKL